MIDAMAFHIGEFGDFRAFVNALEGHDSAERLIVKQDGGSSCWNRLWRKEERAGRERALLFLRDAVAEHVALASGERESFGYLLDCVVHQILLSCIATRGISLNVGVARQAFCQVETALNAWGTAPPIYDQMEFQEGEEAKNVIRFLFGKPALLGHDFHLITLDLIRAGFVHRDEKLLSEVCCELQAIGRILCEQLQREELTLPIERLTEILLGQILGFYPFFEPCDGKVLEIPQKIQGRWEMVRFRVERLILTPRWLGSPMLAFGLNLETEAPSGARPLLLFTGTAQPTASGALIDSWTDFVPGYSVGEFVFNWWAKEKIVAWMERAKEASSQGVEVIGVSLGGSLTLLTVAHRPDLVSVARAFVPTALREGVIADYEKRCAELGREPDVSLYWQQRDIVSLVGAAWAKNWRLFRLIPQNVLNIAESHIKALSAQSYVISVRMNTAIESVRLSRKISNIIYQIFCIPIFIFLSILVLFRGVINLIKESLVSD